jgi:transposase-like protein
MTKKIGEPGDDYEGIAESNKQLAEKIAEREQRICPNCGHRRFRKAGKARGKYSPVERQKWMCRRCKHSMTEDDRRYGNIATESLLYQQALLAAINDPSGRTFRAVAKKAEEIGSQYFWNWQNSTARRLFAGAIGGKGS